MPKPQPDYRTYVYFPILPDSLEDPQEKYSAITNLIKTHIGQINNRENLEHLLWLENMHMRIDIIKLSSDEITLKFHGMNIDPIYRKRFEDDTIKMDPSYSLNFAFKNNQESLDYNQAVCELAKLVISSKIPEVTKIQFGLNSHQIVIMDFIPIADAINNNNHLKAIDCGSIFKENSSAAMQFLNNCSKNNPDLKMIADITAFSNSIPAPAEIFEVVHPHADNIPPDVVFMGDD